MDIQKLEEAYNVVQARLPQAHPRGGFILGTGWNMAASDFHVKSSLPYNQIPWLGGTTVAGHAGELIWGERAGREVFIFNGRRHYYEGAGWEAVALPVYLLKKFGASMLILTNSAGGLRADWAPGSLMLVEDHINAIGDNPLVGPHDPVWGERFPDQSHIYAPSLRDRFDSAARQAGMQLLHGIYLGVAGPAYETPAEVRLFKSWGADAVGSSTVPEAILANAVGLQVAGLSCITNLAAGLANPPLTHHNVQRAAVQAGVAMRKLLQTFWDNESDEWIYNQ